MPGDKSENNLIIFLKYPEEGKVKTRLAKKIGEKKASKIYSIIAKYIVEKFSENQNYNTSIFFSPRDKINEIKDWLDKSPVEYFPQTGTSLGDRISNAFEYIISRGGKNIVIIGTDCIEISREDIKSSFETLSSNLSQIVIGPAADGGYYLLGLNIFIKDIFENIDWSSEKVFNQTVDKFKKQKLRYSVGKKLNDIDEYEDININSIKKIDIKLAEEINSIIIH
ncbi:MAG: TIGR04282 family arsenosugar biosynthesis glycosyltransferase [Thermodesulfobacteriota bacterium]